MQAPNVNVVERRPRKSEGDALRVDVTGFVGVFERGPVFAAASVLDAGELRRRFGGARRLFGGNGLSYPALAPLALHGYHQNGGESSVVIRLAGPGMRSALAMIVDPATGAEVGLVATSAGGWANRTELRIPLRVEQRISLPGGFPALLVPETESLVDRVVRVRGEEPGAPFALGRVVRNPDGDLEFRSSQATPEGRLIVERIASQVDVEIRGAWGTEHHRGLSLLPESARFVWRVLEHPDHRSPWHRVTANEIESTRDWRANGDAPLRQASLPEEWSGDATERELAVANQGRPRSSYLSAVLPERYDALALPSFESRRINAFKLVATSFPRPPFVPWSTPGRAALERRDSLVLTAKLGGGCDDIQGLDRSAFGCAIDLIAGHPAPSIVSMPDLWLGEAPILTECEERASHDPELLRPVPQPGPCGEPPEPPAALPVYPPPPARGATPRASELPRMDRDTRLDLQRELVVALVRNPDTSGDRIALLDSAPGLTPNEVSERASRLRQQVEASAGGRFPHVASLGAQLYPWIRTVDPVEIEKVVTIPASGHVAGVMARTAREGTPGSRFANLEIAGAVASAQPLGDLERGRLNDAHVCTLHAVTGQGLRVLGARSIFRGADPVRYLPASRVMAYLRRSLRELGRTIVFEPNDTLAFVRVRFALEAILGDLHRRDALVGRTAAEAYRVRCDETTTPEELRNQGILIALVHIAPSVPLEFIEVRIGFSRDGASVDDFLPEAA